MKIFGKIKIDFSYEIVYIHKDFSEWMEYRTIFKIIQIII